MRSAAFLLVSLRRSLRRTRRPAAFLRAQRTFRREGAARPARGARHALPRLAKPRERVIHAIPRGFLPLVRH